MDNRRFLNKCNRHAVRAQWHDYNAGMYFVTICTADKSHFFGNFFDNQMRLSAMGKIVNECILSLQRHHDDMELVNHVVTPNHVHLILSVGDNDVDGSSQRNIGCLKPPRHGESCADNHYNSRLTVIISSFKAACSIKINRLQAARNEKSLQIWQRNYHEHLIRTNRSYEYIMEYIDFNVDNWAKDCFY